MTRLRSHVLMIYVVMMAGNCVFADSADWPIFRGNAGLRGFSSAVLPDTLKLLWTFTTNESVLSSPVIAGNSVYAASLDGSLYCIDRFKGTKLWSYACGGPIEAPPLIFGNAVVVSTTSGWVCTVNRTTGLLLWRDSTGAKICASANAFTSASGVRIVVGTYGFELICYNGATGKRIWKYRAENFINGAAAIDKQAIAFGGCDGFIRLLSHGGIQRCSYNAGVYIASSPVLVGPDVFVAHYGGKVLCLDAATMRLKWEYVNPHDNASFFGSPSVNDEFVVVGGRDKYIHCLNKSTGKAIWTYSCSGDVDASCVIAGDCVIAASTDGRLYRLDLRTGKLRQSYQTGGSITASPAVAQGIVVIGCEDGLIYAFGK